MRYLVHHMLRDSAARDADREALVANDQSANDQSVTYGEYAGRSSALASSLRQLGVEPGDRVGVFLKPGLSLPIALLGVSQADAVFVPIHHGLFPEQVTHILEDSGAKGLITDEARLRKFAEGRPLPSQLAWLVVDGSPPPEADVPCYGLETLWTSAAATPVQSVSIENDLAAILYTSGSTGRPKGVMLSHRNLLAGAEIVSEYLDLTAQDRILAALPLSFDAGLNQLTSSLLNGGTTVMVDFRFGRDLVQQLEQQRITGLAGVPSLWNLVTQPTSGLNEQRAAHLRYVTNTGGAMPRTLLRQLRTLLPQTKIYLMYGLTEAFRSTYLPPTEIDRRPDSIGKAIPDTQIFVVDEQGQRCAPGEVGELVHRGPTVSLGYWGHPELTRRVLRPHPFRHERQTIDELVCYSGDLVRQDEEGFLYFVGRRDNQIKSAGFRISPTEVEEVICRDPAARQAAVVGAPDPALGQRLVAFVIPQNGAAIDPSGVIARCAAALPRHMVPKRVELVADLPQTANGKVDYAQLRDALAASPSATADG